MIILKRNFILLFITFLFSIVYIQPSFGVTLPFRIIWDKNAESDLAYYAVYYGTSSRDYSRIVYVDTPYPYCEFCDRESPDCGYGKSQLTPGVTYYIAITAVDSSHNPSNYSREIKVDTNPSLTTTTTATISMVIEAEEMSNHDNGTQQGEFWLLWGNGEMSEEFDFPDTGIYDFEIIAKGSLALDIGPEMGLLIDGEIKHTVFVNTETPETYSFEVEITEGTHEFAIGFYNDYHNASEGIDRNLYVDKTTIILRWSPGIPSTTTIFIPPPPPTSSTSTTTSVKPDETPPTGMVIINQGNETTNSRIVTLQLSAEDDESGMGVGARMMLSNDNIEWFEPKPFAVTKYWVLSDGEGEKTVYVKFCDAAGNWMFQPVSDNIKLEENIACIKPIQLTATALECSDSFLPLWSKEKTVDGKTDTGWLSPLRLFVQEEYVTLDLGETKIVSRIDICSNPFQSLDLFPQDFQVQVSTDNETWTEVLTVEHYSPPASCTDSWAFDETKAQYVKMVTTKPKPFLFFFHLTYIAEIKVHGCSETEMSNSQSTFAITSDRTETGAIELAPGLQTSDKEEIKLSETPPGRPGRPGFILK